MENGFNKIYVFCPYGIVSGGPDALHQIVFYINKYQKNAYLVYSDIKNKKRKIPKPYQVYISTYLVSQEVKDEENAAVIVPESLWFITSKFKKAKTFIWWTGLYSACTSVPEKIKSKIFSSSTLKRFFRGYYTPAKILNYLKAKPYSFENEPDNLQHLCGSYYAYDYVHSHSKKRVTLLIEPISLFFLRSGSYIGDAPRNPVVLYNPKRNARFHKAIKDSAKDLKFIPLIGYTQKELLLLYRSSTLYMDFGSFPGAERIPKEAAFNGCLILTGKNGAAAFHGDVPIPEDDKIDALPKNIPQITKRIHYLLKNYKNEISSFSEYRSTIKDLEKNFENKLIEIFRLRNNDNGM